MFKFSKDFWQKKPKKQLPSQEAIEEIWQPARISHGTV